MEPIALLIQVIVTTVILAPVLWLVGRGLISKEKARFLDAVWIIFLGTIIGTVVNAYIGGLIAAIIMFVVWLALIKHFFDCGWLMAFAVAVVAVILFVIIMAVLVVVLALIGIALTIGF